MTLEQLLNHLDAHLQETVLDGTPEQTLRKSQTGEHISPLMGEIIGRMAEGTGCTSVEDPLDRASAVNSLGPLRLKYMADDAPVDGFRTLEFLVRAVDGAFNEEALRTQTKSD
jgi:hypothetical protein